MAAPTETNKSEGEPEKSSGKNRHKSHVWDYFTLDEINNTVTCTICKFVLKYNRNTSVMHNHLKRHPLASPSEVSSSTGSRAVQRTLSIYTKNPLTFGRKQQITDLLVNFIVKDVRPLAVIHGEGFKEIIKFFEPNYTVPSHSTLWTIINRQYNTLRERIKDEMQGMSVSLTTDLWTSSTMEPYITVTAHYITDQWDLKARVLTTSLMTERHTGVNISDRLSATIKAWDIDVFCTVHDNAASMNLALELCEDSPTDIGCTGHTLQLAIKAGLNLPEIIKAVDAARRVVGHFRHSSVATCALKEKQSQLRVNPKKLQNDCAVRWNSTFMMLERLHEQRIPVQSVLEDETITKPSVKKSLEMRASYWELIEQLIAVLSPLAKATKVMCGELHVGLSFIYPVIFNVINSTLRVHEADLGAIRSFKNTVRQQLVTRFKIESEGLEESIPVVACLLDPRFKNIQFLAEPIRQSAREHLQQLLREDVPGRHEPQSAAATDGNYDDAVPEGEAARTVKKSKLEKDFEQLFGPHFESGRSQHHSSPGAELRTYCATPQIPTMDNPLQWWALNQKKFPNLAKLAKRYLAVPATSTPSERVFSLAGNTITRKRASLHPTHVDTLIFLHENADRNKAKTLTADDETDSDAEQD